MRAALGFILYLAVAATGCDRDGGVGAPQTASESGNPRTAPPATATVAAATRTARLPRIVFLGDSITAGLGVDADQAFPALVRDALAEEEGIAVDVVNAGNSGDTTAGGLARLDWLLRQKPDVLVVGLGGNDGLRGQDVKSSEANLRKIIMQARAAGARVLLLGMMMPPNYGPEYTTQFRAIYPRLAQELNVPLVPFLLEGVGGQSSLNQPDGIHPTPEGHARVAANVLPHLRELLDPRAATSPATGASRR